MALTHQAKDRTANAIKDVLALEDVIEDIVDAIAESLSPEDVFPEDVLNDWAENNGYVKAE